MWQPMACDITYDLTTLNVSRGRCSYGLIAFVAQTLVRSFISVASLHLSDGIEGSLETSFETVFPLRTRLFYS